MNALSRKIHSLLSFIAAIQLVALFKFLEVAADDVITAIKMVPVRHELLRQLGHSTGSIGIPFSDTSNGESNSSRLSAPKDVDADDDDGNVDDDGRYIDMVGNVSTGRNDHRNESLIASAIRKHTPQVSNKMLSIIASLIPGDQESSEADISSLNSEQTTTFDETNNNGDHDNDSNVNGNSKNQDEYNDDESYIDFRDLLLSTQEAMDLGGSGHTYGSLPKTLFSLVKDELLSTNEYGELNINDVLITPITETFSGKQGMIRLTGDLINENTDNMVFPFSALPTIELRLHDLRLQNLDTLVSPTSIFEPTREDYSLENHLNFGTSPDGRKINITISVMFGVEFGEGDPRNIRNELDIGFSAQSFESFMEIVSRLSYEKVYEFPVNSILEPTCWMTLMPQPTLDDKGFRIDNDDNSPEHGLSFKSMIIRPATDSRIVAECTHCTGRGAVAIPELVDILHEAGVTEFMVQRTEYLIEELVLSDMVQTEIDRFVYLSRLTCPHSPEYNISSVVEARKGFPIPEFPKLSSQSLDTLLFSFLQASQVGAVVSAEVFSELLLDHDYHNSTFYEQKAYQPPEGVSLLNYMDLGYKPVDMLFQSARELLAATISHPESGDDILLISYMLEQTLLLDDGVLHVVLQDEMSSFNVEGLLIRLNSVNITGLTTITGFDVLEPIGPQELRNNISLANISLVLDFSIDHLETEDPEQNITITFGVGDLNITSSLIAAFDLDLVAMLNVGSLLNTNYMLGCILSTAHELHVTELLIGMSSINEIRVDGLHPESSAVFDQSHTLIMDRFGSSITSVFPALMDVFVRAMVNEGLTLLRMKSLCPQNQTFPNSRFIDFNDLFSRNGAYGAIPSQIKDAIDIILNSNDPKMNWPIINTALIAPFTENWSGEKGTIGTDGELFALSTNMSQFGLPDFGIGEIKARIFDTHVKNLHSFLPPVRILEPNATSGFLVDNSATIGGRDRPLRFMMKSAFEMAGIHNELEFNLELQEASFFAVLLMMIGTRELFSMEMGNLMRMECLLSLFAVPEIDYALGLALDYLEFDLSSVNVDLSCDNCTGGGLMEVPALIDRLKEAGILHILSGRIMGELGTAMMMPSLSGASDIDGSLGNIMKEFSAAFTARCPSSARMPTTGHDLGTHSTVTESTAELTEELEETILSQMSPKISADTVETVVFSLYPLAQMGIVVFAESLAAQNLTERDPMEAENELSVPQNVHLVNFAATETSKTIEALNLGIDFANEIFSASVPLSGGGSQLGINSIIGSLLDDDGVLQLDANDFKTIMGNNSRFMMNSALSDELSYLSDFLNVTLSHVRVLGLNSFTKADVMKIIGSQTFRNVFGLRYIELEMEIMIETKNEILSYTVSFGAKDIDASISMLLALDEDKMGDLEMGSLLYVHNFLPCFLSFSHDLKVTEFDVDLSSIDIFDVRGFQSSELENASEELRLLIEEHYGDTISDSVSALFNGPVVSMVNAALQQALEDNPGCPAVSSNFEPNTFIDLRDLLLPPLEALGYGGSGKSPYGDVISKVIKVLRRIYEIDANEELSDLNYLLLGPWDDFSLLNETIAGLGLPSLSRHISGSYGVPGEVLGIKRKFYIDEDINGMFTLRLSDLLIENVDTIGAPLSLLEVAMNEPYMLDNVASIGVGERPLRISANVLIDLAAFGSKFVNEFAFSVDLHQVTVALTTITKILERRFLGFPLRDATNFDCWLSTIPGPDLDTHGIRLDGIEPSAGLTQLFMSVAKTDLNISCISCSGPALEDFEEVLAKPEAQEKLGKDINLVLGYVSRQLGGDFVRDQIDKMLHDASKRCPHSPEYDPMFQGVKYEQFPALEMPKHKNQEVIAILIACFFFIGLCAVAGLSVMWIVRRRGQRWLHSLPDYRLLLMKKQEDMETEIEAALNRSTSLFRSPVIPMFARYFIPVTIVGNIALFISGHCSYGGIVLLNINLLGESISMSIFSSSIGEGMMNMFSQGAIAVAIIALLFSIVWPYVKQLISLFLWFVPPRRVSVSTRGSVYMGLDELAKWSMMDIFVLIANIVGLWLRFSVPDISYLPEGLIGFDFVPVPMWGLYANLLAQLVSQISSHFIIHYHRETVRVAREEYEQTCPSAKAKTFDSVESSFDEILQDSLVEDPCVDYDDCSANTKRMGRIKKLGSEDIKVNQQEDATKATPETCDDYSDDKAYQLCRHPFRRTHRGEDDKLVVHKYVNVLVFLICVLICVLVAVGCSLPLFSNQIFGVVGIALAFGRQTKEAVDTYDMFNLIASLTATSKVAGTRHVVGLGLMSALVLVTILLVPIAIAVLLGCQWFAPLTRATRKRLSVAIEILNAWQYADVFLASMIIESWRQEMITAVLFAPMCETFQELFPILRYYGILDEKNAQCMQVETFLEVGMFFLVAGIGLLHLMTFYVTGATKQYFKDTDPTHRRLHLEIQNAMEERQQGRVPKVSTSDVHTPPALFTDFYRWTLQRQEDAAEPIDYETVGNLQQSPISRERKDSCSSDADRLSSLSSSSWSPSSWPTSEYFLSDDAV